MIHCARETRFFDITGKYATVFNEEDDKVTDEIDNKLNELQDELLRLANSKTDYNKVADEIYRLRELKQNTLARNAERNGKRQRIAEMTEFLKMQPKELQEHDEQLVRRLIKKITVIDNKLTIEFKSSVEIEVETNNVCSRQSRRKYMEYITAQEVAD